MDTAPIPVETLLAHREWVRSVAVAVVRDPNAADDVEQEAWLAALTSPPRHQTSLRGWLGTVVRSRARRIGRTDARRDAREAVASRGEATPSAAELAEIADTHRRVVQAVVELAEPYRQTILLRYFEGLAVEEVAARTSVPLDTARSRISRGLAQLRERLSRELGRDDRPWHLALFPLIRGSKETAVSAGVGAAAAGGTIAATKSAWALGAALVVAGLGALVAMSWEAPAEEAKAVAALDAPTAPAASPDDGRANRPAPALRVPRDHAPQPEQASEQQVPDLPEPTAPSQTAQQRLDAARVSGKWQDVPFLDLMGDLSGQVGVDLFVTDEALEALARKFGSQNCSLDFTDASASGLMHSIAEMQGLNLLVEETRVLIVPAGGKRDVSKPLVPVGLRGTAPRSLTVQGVVVDEDGRPVARAAVVGQSNDGVRSPLAETDASGAFSVEMTRPYPDVFATAPGHVPSIASTVVGEYGGTLELRLPLQGLAAVVEGRVLDADERPVAGARVVVKDSRPPLDVVDPARTCGPDGALPTTLVAPPLTTDDDGRFRVDSVAPGELKLTATAEGFAPGSATVEAKASQTVHVDVRLGRAQCWRGTLRDTEGRPISHGWIQAWSYTAKANLRAKTAADGSFTVAGLRPGTLHVRIETHSGRKMERMLNVEGDADLLWDPVLGSGMRIAGRVLDAAGAGVICTVKLIPSPPWLPTVDDIRTKADGEFVFDDVEIGRYRVAARAPVAQVKLPLAVSPWISASDDAVILQATETARMTGRLVGADGDPLASSLSIERVETGNHMRLLVGEDGVFSVGPLPLGRHRVYFRPKGDIALFDAGIHDVGAADLDLGKITLPPSGHVLLSWTAGDAVIDPSPDDLKWTLDYVPPEGERHPVGFGWGTIEDTGRTLALYPGRYAVRMSGTSIQSAERLIDVRSGTDLAIELPIRVAVARRIVLRFPGAAPLAARVRIRDGDGGIVHASSWDGGEVTVPLGTGSFRVELDVTETQTLAGTFDIPAEDAPATFGVTLR